MESIEILRRLTERLPRFPPTVGGNHDCREYGMEEGTCIAWNVLHLPGLISCARWFNSRGSRFPRHTHEQKEWIIVYKGMMHLELNGDRRELGPGAGAVIEPRTPHFASFPEDTWYLAVTYPDSSDWPG